MSTLILATGNPGKVRELREFLTGWDILPKPEGLEIEETGATFLENARLKALTVAQATGHWAVGDDSGLEVFALDGQPGLYSARWGQSDQERLQKLLLALTDTQDRRARFITSMVLASPQEILVEVEGICDGKILLAPRGTGGFGYDPVFYYPPLGLTLAELTIAQKQQVSHRGQALRRLLPTLQTLATL
ncbi:RdgB/HAM1 family non-canonical purine NTP pyrophosphatase [Candidatus Cyanaurora vandensis]|uniref:RdgB/HAM1 family non-canonical purine NTP pyrophosphatase n=1 Tax=Candidatus Cyanaurora vandensis TaxID=2714958 RepID=UPI00257A4065|nr:RdgB/HAM1 family non-canonical purine NTP pyrophosphatase [Candidatus Cyanaurora vandensis]